MKASFYTSLSGHDVLVTVDMDCEPDQRQDVTVELVRGRHRRALRITEALETWAIGEGHAFLEEAA